MFLLGLSDVTAANNIFIRIVRFLTPSKIMRHEWLVKCNNIKFVNRIAPLSYLSGSMSEHQWKFSSISCWPEEIPPLPKDYLWIIRNSADVTQSPLSLDFPYHRIHCVSSIMYVFDLCEPQVALSLLPIEI